MGSENKDNINLTGLLIKISSDVSAIKSDMQNFKDSYKSEKENLLAEIDDVRKDYEKEMKAVKDDFEKTLKQQEAQIKQLTVYTEALRTQRDKEDAKKWRTVIAFILTGVGGLLIGSIPFIIKAVIQAGVN